MAHECSQRSFAIRYLCCRYGNRVREPLRIDYDMPFHSRNLLAGVVSLALRAICVFYTLCIHNAKASLFFATKAHAGRANRIFLMPAPAGLIHLPLLLRPTDKSTHIPSAISDIRSATSSIGNRSLIHIERHRKPRINRVVLVLSFYGHFLEVRAPFQIALDSRRLGILVSCRQVTGLPAILQKDRKQMVWTPPPTGQRLG